MSKPLKRYRPAWWLMWSPKWWRAASALAELERIAARNNQTFRVQIPAQDRGKIVGPRGVLP